MSDDSIYPTHTCFDDSLELLYMMVTEGQDIHDVHLVHALCLAPSRVPYAHAWLELDDSNRAIFSGIFKGERIYLGTPRQEYRDSLNIQESVRYTVAEAILLNRQHENYGPWLSVFRDVCSKIHTVFEEGE